VAMEVYCSVLKKFGYLKNRKAYAVDLSQKRIDIIRSNFPEVIAAVDDAEALRTIEDNTIDFFLSTQVIEHVDQEKMLQSIDRVTKSGSTIYLATVLKKWYGWYFYRNNGRWVIDPTHLREYQRAGECFSRRTHLSLSRALVCRLTPSGTDMGAGMAVAGRSWLHYEETTAYVPS
jgi:ubiquinone/menaquinone biosynthesis C-methylase UbiE